MLRTAWPDEVPQVPMHQLFMMYPSVQHQVGISQQPHCFHNKARLAFLLRHISIARVYQHLTWKVGLRRVENRRACGGRSGSGVACKRSQAFGLRLKREVEAKERDRCSREVKATLQSSSIRRHRPKAAHKAAPVGGRRAQQRPPPKRKTLQVPQPFKSCNAGFHSEKAFQKVRRKRCGRGMM